MYNLVSAAAAAGVNRSTVLRAIKAGRLSAQRDETGGWQIDPAEFHRVFPPLPLPAPASAQQDQQQTDVQIALLRNLLEDLRRAMEDLRRGQEDLRQDRDRWHAAFEAAQRKLPPLAQPDAQENNASGDRWQRAWRWMRATGCLAGAGLLLALSTVPAGAQQQQPQQPPPPGCFTVEMSHSTQGNPQGSILLDRCTGKTWLLLCIRNDTAGCAFRWAPIPDATEPAGGP